MTAREALVDDLVPLAAELVGTIRDYGPDDVAEVLARVPDGRFDALAIVLAAMVDPDARPKQLLAWTELGVQSSREFEPAHMRVKVAGRVTPMRGDEMRAEVARLVSCGLTTKQIAARLDLSERQVWRARERNRRAA